MKKKIIKSYFFKISPKNPSVSNLFFFSKRAIKQKKLLIKLDLTQNNINNFKFSRDTRRNINRYKYHSVHDHKYNQWILNKKKIIKLFVRSFFRNKLTKKQQIFVWYILKYIFFKHTYKNILLYPQTGMLSSHFVHFLAKKNLSYQSRSKYKAKINNMNNIYFYLYFYTQWAYLYMNRITNNIYFFTHNITKQSSWLDEDFNKQYSYWFRTPSQLKASSNTHLTFNTTGNLNNEINSIDYNILSYSFVLRQKNNINNYVIEEDVHKKENSMISFNIEKNDKMFDIFFYAQKLIDNQKLYTTTCSFDFLSKLKKFYDYV